MLLHPLRSAGLLALALSVFAANRVAAQNPGPPDTTIGLVETHRPAPVDIPQPPRGIFQHAPIGGMPPVPQVDAGLPQPTSLPCRIGDVEVQPQAGAFTFFRNVDHRPAGSTSLHPGEPSVAGNRDTWFATGNTYGSLSRDSGMTWSYVNPYTLFPANDGGVCCDQRVLADPGSGLVLWYIQYWYSATTNAGGFRLAWARNRDNLRNSVWSSVYFNAGSFGLPGNWLDYPDIAASGDHVYISSNVFNPSSAYVDSIVLRIPIAQLLQSSTIIASYYRRSGGSSPMGGGASYRFTQNYVGNPFPEMFWASHNSTSSMRVFRWDDANNGRSADVDRTIPAWSSGTGSSPGPDGRDWLGRDDHRIASGYINPVFNEMAWLWSSNAGAHPQSYVRVQVFNPADRGVIATEDVWNSNFDFAYPAVGMNSLGHAGVVMDGGSAGTNVTTYAFLVDNYYSFFQGATIFALATGTNGSPSNRWGDYHSVIANPVDPRTFLGTGLNQSGGTGTAQTVHRTAWFGRDDYTPAWVPLSVGSTGVSGVPITVDETDRTGSKNGTTPFIRSYTPQQGYTLRAPTSVTSGGNTFLFANWSGSGGVSSNPAYTVSSIGTLAQTATANYGLQSVVTVDDRNVAGGVPITVGTLDLDGAANGTTRFTRRYRASDGPFSFTAPATSGSQTFRRWYVANVAQPIGQRTLSVLPTANAVLIEAEYCSYVPGGYSTYGTACTGSNSVAPRYASTSTPDIGASVTHTVTGLAGPTPAVVSFGASRTVWNGLPLPLSLGFVGANPACFIQAEPTVSVPIAINGSGAGSLTFPLPANAGAIGVHVYSYVTAVDVFVPFRTPVITSNGLDMLIGGSFLGGFLCP
ncbi:MAG: hypothetical protein R3F56_01600 [Planctomycetota bacterium]